MTDDADPNVALADRNQELTDPNPGQLVAAAVGRCLELARTWHAWDGRPIAGTMDDGAPNTWTPHKALRRIADHLVDHLHQVEALLAGATPLPDEGLGRGRSTRTGPGSPSRTTPRPAPGCAGSAAGTCCATRPPGRTPGISRGQTPGRCVRSPSTWRASRTTPSRSVPWRVDDGRQAAPHGHRRIAVGHQRADQQLPVHVAELHDLQAGHDQAAGPARFSGLLWFIRREGGLPVARASPQRHPVR